MAGGGGSTGGIGAQSPAVNPPNPMGQIGNAVGGALGGQTQNPMGGGNFVQTGQFGSQPIDMGGGFGSNMGGGMGSQQQMQAAHQQAQSQMPQFAQQMPQAGQMSPSMQQANAQKAFEHFTPQQMADANPYLKALQAGQMSPEMQQANAQMAFNQMQGGMGQQQMPGLGQQLQSGMGQQPMGQMAGLGALLGGMPNQPTPAAKPAPVAAKPAPVAAKPPVVPPKTPPAVASAIRKLAAKKPMMRR